MNTIESGVGIPNGKIRYWLDGQVLISSDSILFRTAANADMQFNQLFYGPYIGVGSPVDQTWWVDELIIADDRLNTAVTPAPGDARFSILPNPVGDILTIRFAGQAVDQKIISIYTIEGQLIFEQASDGQELHVDFPFPGGYYFIRAVDENGMMQTARFVKID